MFDSFFAKKRHQVVFVVSSPRSGSTWLSQALNAHPQIHCTENRLFGPYYDTVYDGPRKIPRLRITLDAYVRALTTTMSVPELGTPANQLQDRLSRRLANAILTLEHELSGKPILVDKFTPYLGTAEGAIKNLVTIFPDAKFVHLVRDGRDVATSGVFHWLNKSTSESEPEMARKRRSFILNSSRESALQRFFCDQELAEWATMWAEANTAMFSLYGTLQVHRVSYEDMLSDHAGELGRLLKFLGARTSKPIIDHCVEKSSFSAMSGGRNRGEADPIAHVRKGVSGDWRTYFCRRDGEVFAEAAGPVLQQLDYESGSSWIDQLPQNLDLHAPDQVAAHAA